MTDKMRQAVMVSPGKIEFREVLIPEAGPGEVLVKIMRIGVCGSDIHVYHGTHPYTSYPVVQGHEVSGIVEKTGIGVRDYKIDDKVTIEPQVACGTCFACRKGMYNICDNLKVLGFQTTGTASDFFAISTAKLVKLPADMDLSHGAMIEPLAVASRAVGKAGGLKDKKVLVFGAGPIGNLTAQTAKALGAETVTIVDPNGFRLEIARQCGIDATVNPAAEDLEKAFVQAFGADGKADIIFECAGAPQALETAVAIARKGTPIVVVGVFGEKVSMDMARVNENELSLIGTARYTIEDFRKVIPLVTGGAVKLTPLITDNFEFTRYLDAYRRIEEHGEETMKVMIRVNGD